MNECMKEGSKEGRKEGRKEARKEGRKEQGRKEGKTEGKKEKRKKEEKKRKKKRKDKKTKKKREKKARNTKHTHLTAGTNLSVGGGYLECTASIHANNSSINVSAYARKARRLSAKKKFKQNKVNGPASPRPLPRKKQQQQ